MQGRFQNRRTGFRWDNLYVKFIAFLALCICGFLSRGLILEDVHRGARTRTLKFASEARPIGDFDFSRSCKIQGTLYACATVEGKVVSRESDPSPSKECLGGMHSWGICKSGKFLCAITSNEWIQRMEAVSTEISPRFRKDPNFCVIDSSRYVCLNLSPDVAHTLDEYLYCLDEGAATGVCEAGWSFCLFQNATSLRMYVPIQHDTSITAPTGSEISKANTRSQAGEDQYAWKNFFYGKTAGVFLEMGALDGEMFSNTWAFEKTLGWTGILIEANPTMVQQLRGKRTASIIVSSAVCEEETATQFVFPYDANALAAGGAVGGIPKYQSKSFRDVHYQGSNERAQIVACVPLSKILAMTGIKSINFFSLDVEGAELAVLTTLDLFKYTVDVFCIEASSHNTTKNQLVRNHLVGAGYALHSNDGSNDWFTRKGFQPSRAPQPSAL